MFSSKSNRSREVTSSLDFSDTLKSRDSWALGQIASLGLGAELTALAYDPVQSLLAVGTQQGRLFVLGAPGVQLEWDLPIPTKVRHLVFRSGSGFLCVVDAKDTLYVFDLQRLDANGKPHRDSSLSLRANVTCLEASACHSFLFIGGKDGTVDAYDIERGALAHSARVGNLWLQQEEILRRSGVPGAHSRRHIPVCTDVKSHPLDINLLLIAYEGGVALFNLGTRQTERSWEFVVPPGAPGGGNDTQETLFMERRAPVTCLAWRPDGLVFAAGMEDGTIGFASLEDEMPIMIRTLERADVNKTTEEDLFGSQNRQPSNREPIFRLAWSAFPQESYYDRATAALGGTPILPSSPTIPTSPTLVEEKANLKGGTVLTVLGGLLLADPVGVHLLELPPYVPPPATSAAGKPGSISLVKREALRASIAPVAHHLYPTSSPPEDFLLLPRSSPHYGLAYDPSSILITSGRDPRYSVLAAPHASNNIEGWTFPPTTIRPPRPLSLPTALSFAGKETCSAAQVVNVGGVAFRQLLHQFDISDELGERLPLEGGSAFPQPRPNRARGPVPSSSDQKPRLLLTSHTDLIVRFWDVSNQLLWGRKENEFAEPNISQEFPRPLRHLEVDVKAALRDPRAGELAAARLFRERPWELELDKVVYAEENGEVAVTLSTGDIVVFRLSYGERPSDLEYDLVNAETALNETVQDALQDLSLDRPTDLPSSPPPPITSPRRTSRSGSLAFSSSSNSRRGSTAPAHSFRAESDPQDHYVDLRGAVVPRPDLDGFRPIAAFKFAVEAGAPSRRTCLALSNIGFLAASNEGHLIVVDLRGPEVLLIESAGAGKADKKGKGKVDASPITVLTWTISPIGEDLDRSPRLLVTQASGLTRVFELSNVGGSWLLNENPVFIQHSDSGANAFASFVLDKHGNPLEATSQQLQLATSQQQAFQSPEHVDARGALTSLWITVSRHTIACLYNIDGPKTAEYEDERTTFEKAMVVHQQGSSVLLVQSTNRMLSIFSLPDLVQIARLSFEASVHDSAGIVSLAPDGDLIQLLDPLHIRLHTVRDLHRNAFPPRLVAHNPAISVPALSNPLAAVGSALSGWFSGHKVYSGTELEGILGGPNRPPPKERPLPGGPPLIIAATKRTKPDASGSATPNQTQYIQDASDSARDIMTRTNAALEQRGEYLGYLQERLGSMATDAANFAAETKKTAQQEAAKRTASGFFGSLLNKLP